MRRFFVGILKFRDFAVSDNEIYENHRGHFPSIYFLFSFPIFRESKVLKRVLECCALNGGVFYSSMVIFDKVLLPLLRILLTKMLGENSGIGLTVWGWMQPALSILFGMIWVMPLFLLSRIVNSLWFQVSFFLINK